MPSIGGTIPRASDFIGPREEFDPARVAALDAIDYRGLPSIATPGHSDGATLLLRR